MQFDNIIGFIIFIVIVVLSIAQKAMEQAKAKRRANEMKREIGDAARHGAPIGDIPVALPRADAGRRAKTETQGPRIEDVIRRLMGEDPEGPSAQNEEEDYGEVRPLPPPVPRHAPTQFQKPARPAIPRQAAAQPTQYQKPTLFQRPASQQGPSQRPLKAQPPRHAVPPSRQGRATAPAKNVGRPQSARESEEAMPIEIEQRENERRWREEMERKTKQQKPQTPQRSPEVLHSRARLMPARRRLFHTAGEVRRAIILSEVLGPPRAMRDLEERA